MNSKGFFGAGSLKMVIACVCVGWSQGTARAQSVYSVNALAYADVNLVGGSNLVANPFSARDNTISNLFRGVPDGSFFMPWNGPMGNFSPTNSFTQAGGWIDPGMKLVAPNGGFLWVPSAMRLSFVGEVWQGLGCAEYPAGEAVLSELTGCTIFCDNFQDPCPPRDMTRDGTVVAKWNGQTQSYEVYQYYDGLGWLPDVPVLAPGESARVWVYGPFSVRAAPGGGVPPQSVSPSSWQRDDAGLIFRFPATNSVSYALLRCFDLSSNVWEVLQQQSASPTGGVATVSVAAETNQMAFYRLVPPFSTSAAVLLNSSRSSNQFQCQFYAPVAAQYELQRTLVLIDPSSASWQTVTSVTAAASNVVTVTDTTATGPRGYYRLRY